MPHSGSAALIVAPRKGVGRLLTANAIRARLAILRADEIGPIVALVVLNFIFSLTAPAFFTADNAVAIFESAAIPTVLAVGMTFIIVQGSIDLSVEGVTASASMVAALLLKNSITDNAWGWWAVVVALLFGAGFGFVNGALYAFLRLPSLIVTLATWFIGLGIATLLFPGRQPQILDSRLTSLAIDKHLGLSALVYVAALVVALGWLLQRLTQFGRLSYAIGADEKTTRQSGLAVRFHKVAAFTLMGLLSGAAGILLSAQLAVGSPVAGQGLLFPTISAAVIGGTLLSGGRGGVIQSVIGVLILEVLRNGMVQWGVDTYLRHVVEGATIIGAVAVGNWRLRSRVRVVK